MYLMAEFSVTADVFKLADLCGRFNNVERFIFKSLSYVITDLLKLSVFFGSSQSFSTDMFIGNRHKFS